jgi:hypothetical protein
MTRWKRPYPIGATTVPAGLMFVVGSVVFLTIGAGGIVSLLHDRDFTPDEWSFVLFAVAWLTVVWRVFRRACGSC